MKEEGGRVLRITVTQGCVVGRQLVQPSPDLPDPSDSCIRSSVEVSLDSPPELRVHHVFPVRMLTLCFRLCVCVYVRVVR